MGEALERYLAGRPRVHLVAPFAYTDFLCLLSAASLVLSDSGGIQEEIMCIDTPLIVLRANTERPECLRTGRARLATDGVQLGAMLTAISSTGKWPLVAPLAHNPFGDGRAGERIAQAIAAALLG